MKLYTGIAKKYREAIDAILWNEQDGIWYDYNIKHQKPRALFYPSNLTPLYTMSYNWALAPVYGHRAVQYLQANGITDYPGKY
jgi:alpha,alpha-trehalase